MPYHWQSANVKQSGVDDMVLLSRINEDAVLENLKKRFNDNCIYTYIGPVLIALNPFKELPIFTQKEIDMYQGAGAYENPPHIYSTADDMYRNMMIDMESHCVIISGESGAGKTVSAKFIMNYISKVSGGGGRVQEVKQVILESNPLLEAFGNAKTVRNNNSSRFGKYVEIQFSRGGQPIGGKVSQFLLEKSRVVHQNKDERNFHVFYQIFQGLDAQRKSSFGLTEIRNFNYVSHSGCYEVPGTNDGREFQDTMHAMSVMRMDGGTQQSILSIVASVLHLGNVQFLEQNNYAAVKDRRSLDYPSRLLGVDAQSLEKKLISRTMESKWGATADQIEVTLNVEQATHTRDALAKALYARMFDYIVDAVNRAMVIDKDELNVGILDIYGFEIFANNGFEQFCINYVNEKLQQIFIELTLRAEQEEYVSEGIKWTPVKYFDNKVVCEMIEAKSPKPGLFSILDDVCATSHAVTDTSDENFVSKASGILSGHEHFSASSSDFTVFHYAGRVTYQVQGFCERNRDQLSADLILIMQSSTNRFVASLFPEDVSGTNRSKRPTTVGSKIRSQANTLVERLMRCVPHYIRCIKPNETKRAGDFDDQLVVHQVKYLGLKENIIVRRAGFAYRRPFGHFLKRYAILTKETWPAWTGDPKEGVKHLLRHAALEDDQWQLGRTKLFVKNPESLFLLEESRQRKFDNYARVIQKAFRKFNANKYFLRMKTQAADILYNQKERHRYTLNRNYLNDYLFLNEGHPDYQGIVAQREKILFSDYCQKFDRRFKSVTRDLILTDRHLYLLGKEKVKKGPEKGKIKTVVKRKIPVAGITSVTMSPFCDNFVKISAKDDYDSLLLVPFKTELVFLLDKQLKEAGSRLVLCFSDHFDVTVKKEGFGGGSTRTVVFQKQVGVVPDFTHSVKTSWSTMNVTVGRGLPKESKPGDREKVPLDSKILSRIQIKENTTSVNRTRAGGTKGGASGGTGGRVQHYGVTQAQRASGVVQPSASSVNKNQGNQNVAAQPRKPPKPPRPTLPPKPEFPLYEALYDFEARDLDEMSLQANQQLEVIEIHEEQGWAKGRVGTKTGWIPFNYIKKLS